MTHQIKPTIAETERAARIWGVACLAAAIALAALLIAFAAAPTSACSQDNGVCDRTQQEGPDTASRDWDGAAEGRPRGAAPGHAQDQDREPPAAAEYCNGRASCGGGG